MYYRLGRQRTGRLGSRVGRRRSLAGVRERERERKTRQRGRDRGATEGERERERCGTMDAGRWMLVGELPGLREKWEREGENERDEQDGGKWFHPVFLPSRNSIFFFFFFVLTWTTPRQRWMDAG